MKVLFIFHLFIFFLSPTTIRASRTYPIISVCESFEAGEIDARKTLEILEINTDDYSIGLNNTAKILCT